MTAETMEKALAAAGWECVGENWRGQKIWKDPVGAGPRAAKPVTSPIFGEDGKQAHDKEGKALTVTQMSGPPCQWNSVTENAFVTLMQRQQASGEAQLSPLEMLNEQGKRIDAFMRAAHQLELKLVAVSKRPVPEKPDNMRKEILDLRNLFAKAIAEFKASVNDCRTSDESSGAE